MFAMKGKCKIHNFNVHVDLYIHSFIPDIYIAPQFRKPIQSEAMYTMFCQNNSTMYTMFCQNISTMYTMFCQNNSTMYTMFCKPPRNREMLMHLSVFTIFSQKNCGVSPIFF